MSSSLGSTRAPAVPPPRWPIGGTSAIGFALALVVAHVVAMFGIGGLIMAALGLDRQRVFDAPPLAFVALIAMAALEIWLVFVVGMRGLGRLRFRDVGWRDGPLARDLALGVLGFALCAAAVLLVIASHTGSIGAAIDHLAGAVASFTTPQRALFVIIGLYAGFSEELIFRGILQPSLQHKLGRWPGIVAGAAVFAVYHLDFRIPSLLGKIGIGVVLGGIADRTGTLWASALAHALIWAVLGVA